MIRHITFLTLLTFVALLPELTGCNRKSRNPEPDSTFAVDIGDSQVPYAVVDTHGQPIQNEPKIPATLRIYQGKELIHEAHIGIEYRGSTSFRLTAKKSYGIETWDADGADLAVPLFGFPAEQDWMFTGQVINLQDRYIFDRTLLYHYLGYDLYRAMGRYASRCQYVELQVNGQYLGLYIFMEKLKRDKNRIDIKSLNADATDLTGGYILKIDKTSGGSENIGKPLSYFESNWEDDARYTAANSFRSAYDIFGQPLTLEPYGPPYHGQQYLETYFLYEYPKAEDITEAQKAYITGYLHDFETALLQDDLAAGERTYTQYIDVASFVDFFLINEISRNVDGYRLSTYLHKDRGGKLAMGPIWDLNIGFDSGDRIPWDGWVYQYNQYVSQDAWMVPFWWPRLLQDAAFRSAVKARWQQLRAEEWSTAAIQSRVDETVTYLTDNGSIRRNYEKWDQGIGVDYEASIQALRDYLNFRTTWMDAEIGGF